MISQLILLLALVGATPADEENAMRDLSAELAEDAAAEPEVVVPDIQLPEGSGNDCFSSRSVSSFEVLDRENIVVFAPSKRHPYWVKVAGFCRELRYSETVGFESRDSRICGYGGDAIIAGDDRCSIMSIHKLDEASYVALKHQIAADRAARGRKR